MADNLYITATEAKSGKSAIVLGMMQLLLRRVRKVAFFRPIITLPPDSKQQDHDIELVLAQFGLDIPYEDTYAYSLHDARNLINSGQHEAMLDNIIKKYKYLESKCHFILCEGTDFTGNNPAFEFDLNAEIAANLGCPVLLVANGAGKSAQEVIDSTQLILGQLDAKGLDVVACLVNRAEVAKAEESRIASALQSRENSTNPLVTYVLPEEPALSKPTLGHFEACVDTRELEARIVNLCSTKITPKMFEYNLLERAAARKMRIVLPEGAEERILRATDILQRRNVADVTIMGNVAGVTAKIASLGLDLDVPIIQPDLSPKFDDYVQTYFELRKQKGISLEQARDTMNDPTYFGTMMVYKGDADGMVSGSINTTAHTIRPAFEFIKTKPGISVVSSIFLMCLKDRVLVFGDCAVNPNPTAEELAHIAISSAHTASIFGITPRVAMLSYSTGASGKGADVEKVKEATRIAKELAPDLPLEGPLQYDAAIDPEVAKTKLPDSDVAGRATVFIFPDLNTGNNTYKAVQRAAGAVAIGPVLQGLNKPVNDLSRGCTVADIVNTVAITAVQAQIESG